MCQMHALNRALFPEFYVHLSSCPCFHVPTIFSSSVNSCCHVAAKAADFSLSILTIILILISSGSSTSLSTLTPSDRPILSLVHVCTVLSSLDYSGRLSTDLCHPSPLQLALHSADRTSFPKHTFYQPLPSSGRVRFLYVICSSLACCSSHVSPACTPNFNSISVRVSPPLALPVGPALLTYLEATNLAD